MNITINEMNLPISEIKNPEIQAFLSKQAEFYINWGADLLIREEQHNSGNRHLNNSVLEKIKVRAVNNYLPHYNNIVNELQDVA